MIPAPISYVDGVWPLAPPASDYANSQGLRLNYSTLSDDTTDLRAEWSFSTYTSFLFLFYKHSNHLNQQTTFSTLFKIKPHYGEIPPTRDYELLIMPPAQPQEGRRHSAEVWWRRMKHVFVCCWQQVEDFKWTQILMCCVWEASLN